ncbi:M14 family zinc carboxypeptidase [Haloprofundus halobius]|uniref:M14 family zinc carboxypeptidase n=1 Tax=Haloprofundus halobius TaxID=2876194 RepID=UPI001CCA7FA6|nr:M14 family zinc carboxypeptidase [Haloprofundus halobius]
MNRRQYLSTVGVAALAVPNAAESVVGAVDAIDAQPSQTSEAQTSLTNERLAAKLRALDERSPLVALRRIGRSAGRDDPLWEFRIGRGETNVHLVTQLHGDEPAGTEAILTVLRELVDDPERHADVLNELTLTVVPRANPDGAMFARDDDGDGTAERVTRRENVQPWRQDASRHEPDYHSVNRPPGYDLNRDFDPTVEFSQAGRSARNTDADSSEWTEYEENDEQYWRHDRAYRGHTLRGSGLGLTPEVTAVVDSYRCADPDVAITHHHKSVGTRGRSAESPSLLSVMAAFGPAYLERAPSYEAGEPVETVVNPFLDAETSRRSLRLNSAVARELTAGGRFGEVTRYGYEPLWGSYLDALSPKTNAAGMLYEVAGQSDEADSFDYGRKIAVSRAAFRRTFEALATDPTLSNVDERRYFDLPLESGGPTER